MATTPAEAVDDLRLEPSQQTLSLSQAEGISLLRERDAPSTNELNSSRLANSKKTMLRLVIINSDLHSCLEVDIDRASRLALLEARHVRTEHQS